MRPVLLAASLILSSAPAYAFGVIVDLPNLTWPQAEQATSSTKGCTTPVSPATQVCK
ncbi:MAG: hypothetical protein ACK4VZ_09250 [Paracoccaceae bacterium]